MFRSFSNSLSSRVYNTVTRRMSSVGINVLQLPNLPSTLFKAGGQKVDTNSFFAGKKVVLFGVPGAYTPVCSQKHVPSFAKNASQFASKGINTVACISVNDPFVLAEWSKATDPDHTIEFIADFDGSLVKALGLSVDLSVAGLGVRSKRFSAVIDNGVIQQLNIEERPSDMNVSGGETLACRL